MIFMRDLLGIVPGDIDEHPADARVESIAKIDALSFAQRVFVESFARKLQQGTVDLWWETAAG